MMVFRGFLRTARCAWALLLGTCVYAYPPGVYVGAGLGAVKNNYHTHEDVSLAAVATSVRDHGMGPRFLTGFQYDRFWGLELGYTDFRNTRFALGANAGLLRQHTLDLSLLSYIPGETFSPFVRLGAGLITLEGNPELQAASTRFRRDIHHLRPVYGLGLQVDPIPQGSVRLEWTRVHPGSVNQAADFKGLSFIYHFDV